MKKILGDNKMETLDYDFYFKQLQAGMWIDETCFYFADDPAEKEHYIGYAEGYAQPYWCGYCDIAGGLEFDTAEQLMDAPIWNGKSLKDRWGKVRICHIEGLPLEDWLICCKHV